MARLRADDVQAWSTLVGRLRQVTIPWLYKRVGKLPPYAMLSEQEFVLEVFADSLARYYELFRTGTFEHEAALQSLMFKVAELKLKEAYARLKKEVLIYRPASTEAFEAVVEMPEWTHDDELVRTRVHALQLHFSKLDETDKRLLQRFYAGEKMSRMAAEMGISEENLRKRKQRALERLKHWMNLAAGLLLLWIWKT